jgi:hypothetical protein
MARSARIALALDVIAGPDEQKTASAGGCCCRGRAIALGDFRVLLIDTHPLGATAE